MTLCDYVLPLKWADDADVDDLTDYLVRLSGWANVIVVDGSPDALFLAHARRWGGFVTHLRPAGPPTGNGKVAGVLTGVAAGKAERVVIADDDVRYDLAGLSRVVGELADADLVGPQNVFRPLPWHARWDSGRTLLNRSAGSDYPGTFAVRRATFEAMGGYDGDVLFENLELMRTVAAWGGRVRRPLDLYVERRPPTAGKFWSQRVRQAYDDFALPGRMAVELAVLPAGVGLVLAIGWPALLAGAAVTVAVAEVGRARGGGRRQWPFSASLCAPLWLVERGVCAWLAVAARARGGVHYAGGRLRVAAHSPAQLRRRLQEGPLPFFAAVHAALAAPAAPLGATARAEPTDVAAVAERFERRPSAPAQGDDVPAGVDPRAVRGTDLDGAANDQRSVRVGGDDDRGLLHTSGLAPGSGGETRAGPTRE